MIRSVSRGLAGAQSALRGTRALARRFGRNQAGAAAVIAAIVFPVIIGGLGLGAETGYWYLMQRKLQHAADVSAHAGAVRRRAGGDLGSITAVATFIAHESGHRADAPPPTVNSPYGGNADAVEVKLEQPVPRLFTSLFTDEPLVLNARAVARVDAVPRPSCVLALSPDAAGAITVSGSATVNLTACDLVSNSSAANSIDMYGAVEVAGGCAYAVGGAQGEEHLTGDCPAVEGLSAPAADPFAHVPSPDLSNCGTLWEGLTVRCFQDSGRQVFTQDMLVDGSLYLITDGTMEASGSLQASNVSFHFTGQAKLSLQGNSTLKLAAPQSGAYNGMLFSGNQNAGITNSITGNVDSTFTGATYFPNAAVEYSGNSTIGCTRIVANTVKFTGNSGVSCGSPPETEISQSSRTVTIIE